MASDDQPPAYTEVADPKLRTDVEAGVRLSTHASSSNHHGFPTALRPQPQPRVGHHGPTPIASHTLIAYYDPHSPYSMEVGAARARRRFFHALLLAFGVEAVAVWIGGMTGAFVVGGRG